MARKLGAALSVVLVALVVGWQPASAQVDLDCDDYTYQEDAQVAFDQRAGDPYGLDGPRGDAYSGLPGVACEELPHRSAGNVSVTPVGDATFTAAPTGVGAGAAGTSGQMADTGSETLPLALAGAAVVLAGLFFLGEEARLRVRHRAASVARWHNGWTTER